MIIKQFQNLKPIELWGSKVDDLLSNKIKIYCVYKDVKFSMDVTSHANFEGDLINGLKYFAVEMDGRLISDFSEIRQTTEKIGLKAMEMWQTLTSLDFESAKVKYLEQRCYNYVNLCRKLGLDWKPTKEMLEVVKDKSLAKNFWPVLGAESGTNFWRMLVDPRIDSTELKQQYGMFRNAGLFKETKCYSSKNM